ncbi:MAG: hypothetical protein FJ222_08030 [Lentisphaerae bacterium]|nr:hypothetical protein [Lentisphaerota bacterium]
MKHSLSIARGLALAAWAAGAAGAAVTGESATAPSAQPQTTGDSFTPYQVIIDRAIFGKPPPARTAAAAAETVPDLTQKQAEALARKITLCAVNRTPSDNTAVGLIDNDAKPPRNLYLNVGDTVDGYTVLAADCDAETATIEKDGVVISLQLGKGLITPGAPAVSTADRGHSLRALGRAPSHDESAAASVQTGVIRRPFQAGSPRMAGLSAQQREAMEQRRMEINKIREEGGDVGSYMEKLRERRTQEHAARAAAEDAARQKIQELARQMTEEELRKREREINLSLIEDGAHPISDIELTPEEEAALVKKGVL